MELRNENAAKQELTVSARLVQSMRLLQMDSIELLNYLSREAEENPAIDIDALYAHQEFLLASSEDSGHMSENGYYSAGNVPGTYTPGQTLKEQLLLQLISLNLSPMEEKVCRFLIECLDDKGFFAEDPGELARTTSISESFITRCLKLLRGFKPVGVFSSGPIECIISQLPRDGDYDVICKLLCNYLPSLQKGHYASVSRSLGITGQELRRLMSRIKGLNLYPSACCASNDRIHYIIPELDLTIENGKLMLSMRRLFSHGIVSRYYCEMLRTSDDPEVCSYISEKVNNASAIQDMLKSRESTVLKCARELVYVQRDFFLHGSPLIPVSIKDISESINLKASTMSRAIKGKYLNFHGKNISLRSLAPCYATPDESKTSNTTTPVLERIKEIISSEDKLHPLSDSAICTILRTEGVEVSRRTVNKYREVLGIPGTYVRKNKEE